VLTDGMGHDGPTVDWDQLADPITDDAARGGRGLRRFSREIVPVSGTGGRENPRECGRAHPDEPAPVGVLTPARTGR
jgi:thymidine phosphorylase